MIPKKTIFLFLGLITLASCQKNENFQNDDGIFLNREIVWEAETRDGTSGLSSGTPGANWIHENTAFVVGTDNTIPTNKLLAIDISTGDRLWEWSNYFGRGSVSIDANHFAVYQDKLAYLIGSRHHMIDISTGGTLWRDTVSVPLTSNDREAHAEYWYSYGPATVDSTFTGFVVRGLFSEPGLDTVVRAPISLPTASPYIRHAQITSIEFVPGSNGKQLSVVYQNIEIFPNERDRFASYLGLYDLEQEEWIYNGVSLNPSNTSEVALYPAKAVGEYLYCSVGEYMGCYEIATGERIWQRELPAEIWISGFTISEGVCAVNCQDYYMYGLDALTGNIKWQLRTAQSSTSLEGRVVDGVVYFVGGSPRFLFAVDLRTGKLVWKLDAERMGKNVGLNKWCYVRQPRGDEPGKVMTQLGTKAICMDAHR